MNASYWFGHTLFRSIGGALFNFSVKDRDKLILDGGVLVVANHQSFLDPPLLGSIYDEGMYFLARKTLFKGVFGPLYRSWQAIPVDQSGPDMKSLKTIIHLLKQGEKVMIFPEGSRTPDGELQAPMPGIGFILSKVQVPVQPIRIFGAYDALPINAKRLKLAQISATVGDPIPYTPEELKARGKEAYHHLAQKAMDAIAALTP